MERLEYVTGSIGRFRSTVCFEMPRASALDGISAMPDLVRSPYPLCWCEGPSELPAPFHGMKRVCFLLTDLEGNATGAEVYLTDGSAFGEMGRAIYEAGAWRSWHGPEIDRFPGGPNDEVMSSCLLYVERFLSLVNCANIDRVENKPSQEHQLRRKKQGKKPLYSYWTLILSQASEKAESKGGTHASPRVHLRRGHIRRLGGKHIWVRACAVGNKKLGVIHKDYAMQVIQ